MLLPVRSLVRPSRSLQIVYAARAFTNTSRSLYPRKDSQDKDSMNTEANEYAKSGTDDDAARQSDAAFNPDKTSPEEQLETAGKGKAENESNPLDVSPANPEVSKQRPGIEGGPEGGESTTGNGGGRERSSGGGSPNKGKKVR